MPLSIVVLGLSITSSWGNGHATTYRALLGALAERGHRILFLERDQPWYAENRDLARPAFARTVIYGSVAELRAGFARDVAQADLVILGSYVPDGAAIAAWALETATGVAAFYDIDTPITLAGIERGTCDYLRRDLIPRFDLYLSFTGGPVLRRLERDFGARRARPLYCSADPRCYYPEAAPKRWDLGYLGTYSPDRQPKLEALLIEPARLAPASRFVVAGPQYPPEIDWPANLERLEHLAPSAHRAFYNAQRFSLNITRAEMARAGWSPSVRLFEAAACGVPIVSDWWSGIESFFVPHDEILIAETGGEVVHFLKSSTAERCAALGAAARARILAAHTPAQHAATVESYVLEAARESSPARGRLRAATA